MKKIALSGKNSSGLFMEVSDEDYELLSKFKWYLSKRGDYAYSPIIAHRMIMGNIPGKVVDHINGNPLDNRRENLRICTQAENQRNKKVQKRNKSGYKGVSTSNAKDRKYRAFIQNNFLGNYSTAEEAAKIYDKEAKIRFGDFAKLNFPEDK